MADKSRVNKYSVYAGLDDAAPVNWGTVANTITEQLGELAKEREGKKQAIEDATQKQMEALNELPDVNSRSLSKLLIEAVDGQKKELMVRNGLLKRGIIKPKDYKLFMNEIKNGYDSFGNVVKTYDKWYVEAMKKVNAGTATNAEVHILEQIESFGNLDNKQIMTNPANGQLQIVTMLEDKDGKYTVMPDPKTQPDHFQNPSSVLQLMTYDGGVKKDLTVEATKITDSLATIITSQINNGSIKTLEDFRQIFDNPETRKRLGFEQFTTFDSWLTSQAVALTADDSDITQILTESLGYKITNDPNNKDPKSIYIDTTSGKAVFNLTEDQKTAALTHAKNTITQQLDSKVTQTTPFRRDATDQQNIKDTKKQLKGVDFATRLTSPIYDEAKTAQNMLETDPLYKDIENIAMKDIDGNLVEKESEDFNVDTVDVIEFTMLVDGKLTPLQVETKKKGPNGELLLKNGKPISKSGEEITRGILVKLNVPAKDVESYIQAHKDAGKKFNKFEGITAFNRSLGDLSDVGSIPVQLGAKKFPAAQGITEVLKNTFDEDEGLEKLKQYVTDAPEEEKGKKQEELNQYKWALISNMVNQAFNSKNALGGRRKFKLLDIKEGDTIKINYDNNTIDLGLTFDQIGNDGAMLMDKIQEAINKPQTTNTPPNVG
tara:strand:- start:2684 stop:4663 length:1980 start_codon:yes stop_codon:yes gene_type:complete